MIVCFIIWFKFYRPIGICLVDIRLAIMNYCNRLGPTINETEVLLAQLVERATVNRKVTGSIPV